MKSFTNADANLVTRKFLFLSDRKFSHLDLNTRILRNKESSHGVNRIVFLDRARVGKISGVAHGNNVLKNKVLRRREIEKDSEIDWKNENSNVSNVKSSTKVEKDSKEENLCHRCPSISDCFQKFNSPKNPSTDDTKTMAMNRATDAANLTERKNKKNTTIQKHIQLDSLNPSPSTENTVINNPKAIWIAILNNQTNKNEFINNAHQPEPRSSEDKEAHKLDLPVLKSSHISSNQNESMNSIPVSDDSSDSREYEDGTSYDIPLPLLGEKSAAEISSCVAGIVAGPVAGLAVGSVAGNLAGGLVGNVAGKVVNHATGKLIQNLSEKETEEEPAEAMTQPVPELVGGVAGDSNERVSEATGKGTVPNALTESVNAVAGNFVSQVSDASQAAASQFSEQVTSVSEQVVEQVSGIGEHVNSVKEQVVGQVTEISEKVVSMWVGEEEENEDEQEEDEFETIASNRSSEFRGVKGLSNFTVIQNSNIIILIHDVYLLLLKQPLPIFVLAMTLLPLLVSFFFTLLYLPDLQGLALDETVQNFLKQTSDSGSVLKDYLNLNLNFQSLFRIFMFSISLTTGLESEIHPLSPYTLAIANANSLISELIFVFLSGAVFARLSQPSKPVRCADVALISPLCNRKRNRCHVSHKELQLRYVLEGPQPCELVDVKLDVTYKYNATSASGSYFRAQIPLKLTRSEVAYQTYGMVVRHVIDENSVLFNRNEKMMEEEDGVFSLSVVGTERSSMQPIFHVHHYGAVDGHVIWNAEFEDMVSVTKRNRRIIDYRKISNWRSMA